MKCAIGSFQIKHAYLMYKMTRWEAGEVMNLLHQYRIKEEWSDQTVLPNEFNAYYERVSR